MLLFYVAFAVIISVFINGLKDPPTTESPGATNCTAALPPKGPTAEELISGSPYKYYWTLNKSLECFHIYFTKPRLGFTNYSGTFLANSLSSNRLNTYLFLAQPEKNHYLLSICDNCAVENVTVHNVFAYKATDNGSYFCFGECYDDRLTLFACYANTEKYAKEIKDAVDKMRKIPNGEGIHRADEGCLTCPACPALA